MSRPTNEPKSQGAFPTGLPRSSTGRWLEKAAVGLALAGGAVLLGLTLFTVFSVIGAAVFNHPILGDAEVTEMATAFAVFSFFPYCQLKGGHVVVDFFTANISPMTRNILDGVNNIVFAVLMALLTWRLVVGGLDAWRHGEYSMMLEIPHWWGYLGSAVGMILLTLVCGYTAYRRLQMARG